MYIFYINIYSYFTSVINNRLQEFYIRFIKITLQTFIIIFKDHPISIVTLLIILSFDAFQSNWTGIIIDSFRFVKGLVLKFGLNFREFYFYSFFIGFFCFRLYFLWNFIYYAGYLLFFFTVLRFFIVKNGVYLHL